MSSTASWDIKRNKIHYATKKKHPKKPNWLTIPNARHFRPIFEEDRWQWSEVDREGRNYKARMLGSSRSVQSFNYLLVALASFSGILPKIWLSHFNTSLDSSRLNWCPSAMMTSFLLPKIPEYWPVLRGVLVAEWNLIACSKFAECIVSSALFASVM